mgnify:CR=1 FL=1
MAGGNDVGRTGILMAALACMAGCSGSAIVPEWREFSSDEFGVSVTMPGEYAIKSGGGDGAGGNGQMLEVEAVDESSRTSYSLKVLRQDVELNEAGILRALDNLTERTEVTSTELITDERIDRDGALGRRLVYVSPSQAIWLENYWIDNRNIYVEVYSRTREGVLDPHVAEFCNSLKISASH